MTGCHIKKCKHFINGKCNDPTDYINEFGEDVCGLRDDAIPYEEYIEIIQDDSDGEIPEPL